MCKRRDFTTASNVVSHGLRPTLNLAVTVGSVVFGYRHKFNFFCLGDQAYYHRLGAVVVKLFFDRIKNREQFLQGWIWVNMHILLAVKLIGSYRFSHRKFLVLFVKFSSCMLQIEKAILRGKYVRVEDTIVGVLNQLSDKY